MNRRMNRRMNRFSQLRSQGLVRLASSARQDGFSLIVALMMLIVIIILGISASQMAINEERGARNDRDRQIAFQAAEAALKDAEYEILNPAAPACGAPGERGRGRTGTFTCFNQTNSFGFVSRCSTPPNAGLCDYNPALPAWLDPDPVEGIDFLKDAKGTGNNKSVSYGTFSGKGYGSQLSAGMSGQPLSTFPPRYIIEIVPKNTSIDTLTGSGAGGGLGGGHMFRVTAMGFGANANSQVVLQTVVSTQD